MPEPKPMDWEDVDSWWALRDGGFIPLGLCPAEALFPAIALARQEKERADKAIAGLAECYRLTGADPDGNEDWRLAEHAVGEVRQLRKDCDDALNWEVFSAELAARLALADKLAEAVGAYLHGVGAVKGYALREPMADTLRAYLESAK